MPIKLLKRSIDGRRKVSIFEITHKGWFVENSVILQLIIITGVTFIIIILSYEVIC